MPTRVVHCKREPYDIYIGRPGRWGNDWSHIRAYATQAKFQVGSVREAVQKHREWFLSQPELVAEAKVLFKDKVLGCWCKIKGHEPCHGDVYAEVANSCS